MNNNEINLNEEAVEESMEQELKEIPNYEFESPEVAKISKDLKKKLVHVPTKEEARFIEDYYYQAQARRIAIAGQIRAIKQKKDSNLDTEKTSLGEQKSIDFLEWMLLNAENEEGGIKKALEIFSDTNYLAKWAKKVVGIGPVIATCLCANFDIIDNGNNDTNMHAGSWWNYAGLNDNNRPWIGKEGSKKLLEEAISENDGKLDDMAVMRFSQKTKWQFSHFETEKCRTKKGSWNKEELIKRASIVPYNKDLKVLMYKIGHSFRMVKNNPNSLYGRLLKQREEYELKKNIAGDYAEQAAKRMNEVGKSTEAYKHYSKGELPPAHIAQRAERYVTKLFISHLFEAAYWNKYGKEAPKPYVLCFEEGHTDYIAPEVPYNSVERD